MKKKWIWDILIGGSIFFILFLYIFYSLGFGNSSLAMPYDYKVSDTFQWYMLVKSIGQNGWFWENTQMAAPFGFTAYDYTAYFLLNFDLLMMKIFYAFFQNYITCINIWYILCFSLSALVAYGVLRSLKFNYIFSGFGAVVFGLAPYIVDRGIEHITLSACYFVPLSVLLCIWCFQEDDTYIVLGRGFWKNKKNLLSFIFALLIANNGAGYAAFFTCFLLCVTALCCFFQNKRLQSLKRPIMIIFLIIIFSIICLLPVLFYEMREGNNIGMSSRAIEDGEIYGLKIAMFFIPLNGHGIPVVEHLINNYTKSMPLINENRSCYLGIAAGIGFLLSLLSIFDQESKHRESYLYSRLNLFSVLLATVGGFAGLISMYFHLIRGYNRISIYIMFISIIVICRTLDTIYKYFWQRGLLWRIGSCGIIALFMILCILEQLPNTDASGSVQIANSRKFDADREYIASIEAQLNEGDMVFQLPHHAFPEDGGYHQLIGYLHSDTLRWSFGGMKGREAEVWGKSVSELSIKDMINELCLAGFRGIYIEKVEYGPEELQVLCNEIERITGAECLESEDVAFYSLYPYIESNGE